MNTTELEFSEVAHDPGKGVREWVLRGPCGAVNFLYHVGGSMGLVLGVHRPATSVKDELCDLLPEGRCSQSAYFRAAGDLGAEFAPRGDVSVIRATLRMWYEDELEDR